jgi:hypothetical protein
LRARRGSELRGELCKGTKAELHWIYGVQPFLVCPRQICRNAWRRTDHVDPTQPPQVPFPGDTLAIKGTIYRGGTLPSGIANNDPGASGGIGKITCRALILVQPTDFTTPAASFVTELYTFSNDTETIIADGPGANLYATVLRAVLGGTGHFESVTGEIIEKNIGLNSTGFRNLRITFKLNKSGSERHG